MGQPNLLENLYEQLTIICPQGSQPQPDHVRISAWGWVVSNLVNACHRACSALNNQPHGSSNLSGLFADCYGCAKDSTVEYVARQYALGHQLAQDGEKWLVRSVCGWLAAGALVCAAHELRAGVNSVSDSVVQNWLYRGAAEWQEPSCQWNSAPHAVLHWTSTGDLGLLLDEALVALYQKYQDTAQPLRIAAARDCVAYLIRGRPRPYRPCPPQRLLTWPSPTPPPQLFLEVVMGGTGECYPCPVRTVS